MSAGALIGIGSILSAGASIYAAKKQAAMQQQAMAQQQTQTMAQIQKENEAIEEESNKIKNIQNIYKNMKPNLINGSIKGVDNNQLISTSNNINQ